MKLTAQPYYLLYLERLATHAEEDNAFAGCWPVRPSSVTYRVGCLACLPCY